MQREFLTRVRKKSFLWTTILGPVMFGAMMVVPIALTSFTAEKKIIEVVDENLEFSFADKLIESESVTFLYFSDQPIDYIKKVFLESEHHGLLYIPKINLKDPKGIILYSKTNVGLEIKSDLEYKLKTEIENIRLKKSGIDPKIIDSIKTNLAIQTINLSKEGEEDKNTTAATIAGLTCAILIYFFIFLYGSQVMRGVIEEKTSRIIEVIITSVKPFELMMGKILGIASVALVQFFLWVLLTVSISGFISSKYKMDRFSDENLNKTLSTLKSQDMTQALEMNQIVTTVQSLQIPYLIAVFIFYFMGGYLIYAALFAAIGSAVDNETDTQQFMLPITVPLIMAFVFAQTIIKDPDSSMAFWLSIIPFTSPIIMMVRLPFGVPILDLVISMTVLVVSFLVITFLAARIYKVGILMYGKKTSYKEILKWLFYK